MPGNDEGAPDAGGARSETAHVAAWNGLRRVLHGIERAVDRGSFLDDCLDVLVDALGANRGLVLLYGEGGAPHAINARGKGRSLDPYEREEISKTVVARACESGECVSWKPLESTPPTESMHVLGIATAVAAPLRTVAWREGGRGEPRVRGALYLDFRDRRREVGTPMRELVEAAASIMAAVLDPYEKLLAAREDLRETRMRSREDGPGLDELLAPDSMRPLRGEVASCLRGDSAILITGESGTGKTQLARAIAEASGRLPVVRAMLGTSDDLNTIASELFGHEKGAFSGALAKRIGVVEYADGGTLIFDEILNLPRPAQQLLLDFTQFGTFRPLGWEKREPKRARVRIIAATNGALEAEVSAGRFRQDLYYRLAAVTLHVPPLRERRQDIPGLAEGMLRRLDRSRAFRLSVELRRLLLSPQLLWPGNVRQLEAAVVRGRERALHEDPEADILTPAHVLPREAAAGGTAPAPALEPVAPPAREVVVEGGAAELQAAWARLQIDRGGLETLERKLIAAALEKHGGVVAHAARELGVARTSLLSRIDTLGLSRAATGRGARRPK